MDILERYLVLNSYVFENFKQGLTKPFACVCIVDFRETKKCALEFPFGGCRLLNPVTRYSKIAIGITGLPCVASDVHFTCNLRTLWQNN